MKQWGRMTLEGKLRRRIAEKREAAARLDCFGGGIEQELYFDLIDDVIRMTSRLKRLGARKGGRA